MRLQDNNIFKLLLSILLSKQKNEINVFLCGKNSADKDSLRGKINTALNKYSRINVLYPEWLFQNLLEQANYDLLSLETKLANDVDKIILPLEGLGTFCELGSFVMNDKIREKLIVINDKAYENKDGFVNKGPLRLIKKSSLGEVIYTDLKQQDSVVDIVEKRLKFSHHPELRIFDFSNLFSLTYLVGLIILIYQPINKRYLDYLIKQFNKDINTNFIDPTLEFLIYKEQIKTEINDRSEESFLMTKKGINDYENSFQQINALKLYFKIRSIALWTKPDNRYKFSNTKERARLLEP